MVKPNKQVLDILNNARSVKGEGFVELVKVAGVLHGFCMVMLARMAAEGADDEMMDRCCDDAGMVMDDICGRFAAVFNLPEKDLEAAINLVHTIDDQILNQIRTQ